MPDKRSFVALDGLRGIAAITVVVGHAPAIFGRMPEFYLAVDFFFVLSGFVLAHAYSEQLCKGMSAREFMLLRLIRLYPLYILGTAIGFGVALSRFLQSGAGSAALSVDIVTAILFLPSPLSPNNLYPLDPPAWSLLFELLVNFWFGVIGKGLNGVLLWGIIGVCAALMVLLVSVVGTLNFGSDWRQFPGGCVRVGFSFFTGVLLYRLWLKKPSRIRLPVPVIGAVLLTLLVLPIPRGYGALYASIVSLGVIPLLIWIAASSPATGIMGRVCAWLGAISYGAYILHSPIWRASFAFGLPRTLPYGLLILVTVLIISDLATRYFEKPLRRRLSGMIVPKRAA
jgi:peptidoglycan/LPS O-acetylase OafA/YrhL